MQKFFLHSLPIIFFLFSVNLADFQKTSTIAQQSTDANNSILHTMDNNWTIARRRGRSQNNQARGNRGGRGGRLAPAAAGRTSSPSSPITSRLSVQQHIPSDIDTLLDVFLQVPTLNPPQRITMDVHHVKKSTVDLEQSHGYSYPDHSGLRNLTITAPTSTFSLELCCPAKKKTIS